MFPKVLTPLAVSIAMVAGLQVSQISSNEESEYILEPVDLNALVQDGMTKKALETMSSQINVYLKLTNVDDAINAMNSLTKDPPTGPPTIEYDLASLKARIIQGASPSEKHGVLKDIFEDKLLGPSITKCDAFELFAYIDPLRALRDLRGSDPLRSQLKLRGDKSAEKTPLEYPDACFTKVFSEFEPTPQNTTNENMILFSEGVVKPRVKHLLFHSGVDYGLPTKYREPMMMDPGSGSRCTDECEANFTIKDPDGFKPNTEYRVQAKKTKGYDGYTDHFGINWTAQQTKYDILVQEQRRYSTENLSDDKDQYLYYWVSNDAKGGYVQMNNRFNLEGNVYSNIDADKATWDEHGVPLWNVFITDGDEASWQTIPKAWKNEYVYGQ